MTELLLLLGASPEVSLRDFAAAPHAPLDEVQKDLLARQLDAFAATLDGRRYVLFGDDPDDPIATHIGPGNNTFVTGSRFAVALGEAGISFVDRATGVPQMRGWRVSQRLLAPKRVEFRNLESNEAWVANFAIRQLVSYPSELTVLSTRIDATYFERELQALRERLA